MSEVTTATTLGWSPEEPTARGVANAVSRAIREGTLKPGMKLPPIRSVAAELRLSPTTISAGWSLLARSGAIQTDGRRGTTIAEIHPGSARYRKAMDRHSFFTQDLSTGVPDPSLLPDLSTALQTLTTAATPGGYLDEPVVPELLALLRQDWPYPAEQFTIVDGAMDAIEMVSRAMVRFGDRVVVEHPTFPLLLDQLEAAGADVVGVPLDDQGMLPGPLAEALSVSAAAVLVQPRAHNPTGVSLTTTRAQKLADIIRAAGSTVIEDDSAGSVAVTEAISLGSWIPQQTLHIRSFSKSHGPDLRLAAMSGPETVIDAIVSRRQLGQGWSSRFLQRILLGLLIEEEPVAQVAHAREEYQRRRQSVITALAERGVEVGGNDGINIWVPVADESAAIVRLASQGIGVTPGAPFTVLADSPGHIRVTVGAVAHSHTELAEMIAQASRAGGWVGGR
ncbi:aminotransferase class I/II-fold pyridoxal phosphate-dependent enzyme [Arthrobacter castelli]|uniref:aminotransferase class I/II-fold pyridoxal phosphate-dependent enzyme n=1 Tax=Arthrobacter castelli TaxID=271431 RepID=UPI000686F75B|nr:aminotransferase class I/II-fold pyridoxal phosphate-dependent enzyme [Arthrobacter castelli]